MRALRTFASAVAILVGAVLLVLWLISFLVVRSVEDGSGARTVAAAALKSPAVMNRVVDDLDSHASASLTSAGVDLDTAGLDTALRSVLERLTASPEFESTVLDAVDDASERFHAELTDDERVRGPFTVSFDASSTVNEELGSLPVVGDSVPEVRIEPVAVEVMSAEAFDKARSTYSRLEFAKAYFLWAGLACVVLGVLVSTRRRYVVGKFLLAVGVMSLSTAALLFLATPERIASALPGGSEGTWGRMVADVIGSDHVPRLRTAMLLAGAIAVVAGAAATLIGKAAGHRR